MQKVKLNIVPKGVKKTTYLSQNDNGRVVRYELFNELVPYTLDGSETITVKVVRPDGEEIVSSVPNTEEAYIDVTFNDDMSAIAGVGAGEIKITDGETVLGSHNFDINVEIDAYNGKDVVIETETGTLLSFNTEVEDNALEYESEIPYNAEGYTGLRVINSRSTPAYDKTPYLFRKTPSGYGNSCIEKLTGLSVAFNQLVENGNFVSASGWTAPTGTFSVSNNIGSFTPTAQNQQVTHLCSFVANHKYFISVDITLTTSTNKVYLRCIGENRKPTDSTTSKQSISTIINSSLTSNNSIGVRDERNSDFDTIKIENCICIDLTQMLGSTLADYIYSLEQATAGAGVSLFKSLGFDKPYYEYNAGSLLSSKPVSKKVVGFNQWSEEWEAGTIDNAGRLVPSSQNNQIRSKNYCNIIGGETYYATCQKTDGGSDNKYYLFINFYDANKVFISKTFCNRITFVTPANAKYFKLNTNSGGVVYGNVYNNDICVNISDPDKNGTYEPYSEETYNLGGDELRGLLKLDSNNNIYADGDIYESNGDVTRRYGIVDLGSLTWNLRATGTNNKGWSSELPNNYIIKVLPNWLSLPSFIGRTTGSAIISDVDGLSKGVYSFDGVLETATNVIYIITAASDTPSGYLVYELATPTSESADPYTDPQEARITEEFIDNRAIPIPVGQDSIYGTDIEYQDIDFDTTIFGGEIDAINGVLSSEYNSDGSVKTTPEIIDITPTPIPVRAGDNKIFNSANGNQTIRYYNQVEE